MAGVHDRPLSAEKIEPVTGAPAWGGNSPSSLNPFDNWGVNHPLHFRWNRDQDGDGGNTAWYGVNPEMMGPL